MQALSATLSVGGLLALMGLLGPLKGAVAAIVILGAVVVVVWPFIGVIGIIFSGTCLQIVGSSELVGLPMSLGKLLGLLTLGSWILHLIKRRPSFTFTPQLYPLAVLLVVVTLSTFLTPQRSGGGDMRLAFEGLFRIVQVYLLYVLLANITGESRAVFTVVTISVMVAISVSGVISVCEYFVPSLTIVNEKEASGLGAVVDDHSIPGVEIRKVSGGVGDSNLLAFTVATAFPLNIFFWRRFRGFWPRCFTLLACGLLMAAMLFSYTRGGVIGLACALMYLLWKRRLPWQTLASAGLLACVVGLFWMPTGFAERMFSVKYLKEGESTSARRELIFAGVHAFQEAPFFGHGYGQFGSQYLQYIRHTVSTPWSDEIERSINSGKEEVENVITHNMYLEIAVEYGLAGLIPFLAFSALIFSDLALVEKRGSPSDADLAVCLSSMLICFIVCAVFGSLKVQKI
ncbi:MAG: O-antigen ligase family protein, partial [Planctomycetaceae bacterium]|nr:O-antigen ligase family protein [Planctomycetaceae bacterium]